MADGITWAHWLFGLQSVYRSPQGDRYLNASNDLPCIHSSVPIEKGNSLNWKPKIFVWSDINHKVKFSTHSNSNIPKNI